MNDNSENSPGAPELGEQATDPGRVGTYSILLHLRRTVYEDAYVSVPLTGAVMRLDPTDGSQRIDFDLLVAEAKRISENPQVEWRAESTAVEPHPVQQPLPEDRRTYDPFLDPERHTP
jgi:hypothetical protein